MIGSLGNYVFEVLNTPYELNEKATYSYTVIETPERQLARTGTELREVRLSIKLVRNAGVDPEAELERLKEEALKETPLKLIIGNKVLGNFVITEIERLQKNINALIVNLTLKEYR